MKRFSCVHCGKCCTDVTVQIYLTFGDITRLSKSLKKPINDLYKEGIIGFYPFFDPEKEVYEIEIGLTKQCKLWKNGKCSNYKGRPINCRLFPYWLLATNVPVEEMFDESYGCVHGITVNEEDKTKYKKYCKALGEILLEESEITDKALREAKSRLGIPLFLNLSEFKTEEKRITEGIKIIQSLNLNPLFQEICKLEKLEWKELD